MNKTLTNLLRSAFVVVCILCGVAASNAQTQVIAAGGTVSDSYACTIGEVLVGDVTGMWADAENITSGIDGVFTVGDVVVGNVAKDSALNIQLPAELVAAGAYYNVYNLQGMLLESNKIDATNYSLKYSHLLSNTRIIVTINTAKGVVATYKLSK